MLLDTLNMNLGDVLMLALLLWLFIRTPWVMSALALLVVGGMLLFLMPLDIYYSMLPLPLLGLGLGMLFHTLYQRRMAAPAAPVNATPGEP